MWANDYYFPIVWEYTVVTSVTCMQSPMKRNLVLLAVALLIAFGGYTYWQSTQSLTKLTYPTAIGASAEIVIKIMKFYDIDRKHGLDVEPIALNPTELERQEFSGELEGILIMSPLSAARLTLEGRPMKILAPLTYMPYSIAVRTDSSIATLSDLKGKKVGILPKVVDAYKSIAIIFRSAGIDPDRDLLSAYGSIPEMIALLAEGEVDATLVSYPGAAGLFASGQYASIAKLEKLWETNEGGLPHPFIFHTVFADWYEQPQNRDTARRFFDAYFETIELMRTRPEVMTEDTNPSIKEYLERNNLTSETAKQIVRNEMTAFLPVNWSDRDVVAIEHLFDIAEKFGYLPQSAPKDIIVSPSEFKASL